MYSCNHQLLFRIRSCAAFAHRFVHISSPSTAGQDWRIKVGLPSNPNAYGPLTDLPDYTFLDGRRTPVGSGKLKRAVEQEQLAEKIMALSSEIDFAIQRRVKLDEEEAERRQSILDRKLKQKGDVLVRRSPSRRPISN